MRVVEIGSSADAGSSIRITSGSTASRARDAEALLLPAREAERVVLEPVLHLVPERGLANRALDALVEVRSFMPSTRGTEGDVVVDRLRERVRLLEDHADPPSHLDRIDRGRVEVLAVVEHASSTTAPGNEVVHPVEAADERALAAAGRADEGGDEVLPDLHRHVAQCDGPAVGDGEVGDVEHDLAAAPVGRQAASSPSLDVDLVRVGSDVSWSRRARCDPVSRLLR